MALNYRSVSVQNGNVIFDDPDAMRSDAANQDKGTVRGGDYRLGEKGVITENEGSAWVTDTIGPYMDDFRAKLAKLGEKESFVDLNGDTVTIVNGEAHIPVTPDRNGHYLDILRAPLPRRLVVGKDARKLVLVNKTIRGKYNKSELDRRATERGSKMAEALLPSVLEALSFVTPASVKHIRTSASAKDFQLRVGPLQIPAGFRMEDCGRHTDAEFAISAFEGGDHFQQGFSAELGEKLKDVSTLQESVLTKYRQGGTGEGKISGIAVDVFNTGTVDQLDNTVRCVITVICSPDTAK